MKCIWLHFFKIVGNRVSQCQPQYLCTGCLLYLELFPSAWTFLLPLPAGSDVRPLIRCQLITLWNRNHPLPGSFAGRHQSSSALSLSEHLHPALPYTVGVFTSGLSAPSTRMLDSVERGLCFVHFWIPGT